MKGRDVSMVQIYKSRYTPGLKNGEDVYFNKGERVRYRMRNGCELDIIIDCDDRMVSMNDSIGYEAIFTDDGKRYFAVAKGIINWEGKQ
jgi:hypothetical protein